MESCKRRQKLKQKWLCIWRFCRCCLVYQLCPSEAVGLGTGLICDSLSSTVKANLPKTVCSQLVLGLFANRSSLLEDTPHRHQMASDEYVSWPCHRLPSGQDCVCHEPRVYAHVLDSAFLRWSFFRFALANLHPRNAHAWPESKSIKAS